MLIRNTQSSILKRKVEISERFETTKRVNEIRYQFKNPLFSFDYVTLSRLHFFSLSLLHIVHRLRSHKVIELSRARFKKTISMETRVSRQESSPCHPQV